MSPFAPGRIIRHGEPARLREMTSRLAYVPCRRLPIHFSSFFLECCGGLARSNECSSSFHWERRSPRAGAQDVTEQKFLLPWLSAAAVITVVRLLHATGVDDLTIQIQAAQNLLDGKGLVIYWRAAEDLSKPLALHGLTHYSAGILIVRGGDDGGRPLPGGVWENLGTCGYIRGLVGLGKTGTPLHGPPRPHESFLVIRLSLGSRCEPGTVHEPMGQHRHRTLGRGPVGTHVPDAGTRSSGTARFQT